MKKSVLIKAGSIFIASFVVLVCITYLVTPVLVSRVLMHAVREGCKACNIRWDSTKISLFPTRIKLNGFMLHWGEPLTTQVEASAQSIQIDLILCEQFDGTTILKKVLIEQLKVVVIEGDKKTPHSRSAPANQNRPVLIQKIELTDSDFIYQKIHIEKTDQKVGQVHVRKIRAWGIPPQPGAIRAELTGVLENTGNMHLTLLIPNLESPTFANMSLGLHAFEMNDANAYFTQADGINLLGTLIHGDSAIMLKGPYLSAWVHARYRGLKIEFIKTEDRSGISATVSTFISGFKVHRNKVKESGPHPKQPVKLARHQEETILSFIFRGLKEAALLEIK